MHTAYYERVYLFYGFLWERPEVSKNKTLGGLIAKHSKTKVNQLPTDMQVVLGFLNLIVDIKYRNRYGAMIDGKSNSGYSEEVQFNKVLADQVSPVDNGLLGY